MEGYPRVIPLKIELIVENSPQKHFDAARIRGTQNQSPDLRAVRSQPR